MPFIRWIALICVGTGVAVIVGGIALAFMESRTYRGLSGVVTKLGDISATLTDKQVASDAATDSAMALADVAQALSELIRVMRGPAKSAQAFRIGLLLVFGGVGLAIVDYTVEGKEADSMPTTTTVAPAVTTTTKP
jgi:hypothetical protein